ncbi:hypothetical protein AB4142_36595, partial [Variovorax sp. 2RAF20]
ARAVPSPTVSHGLRCAVASFDVKDGVMRADKIIADTGVVVAKGEGTINLKTERLDLRIEGDIKMTRLVRLFIQIEIKGPLA